MKELSFDEVVELITKKLEAMGSQDLACLYNREFEGGLAYEGNEIFTLETE